MAIQPGNAGVKEQGCFSSPITPLHSLQESYPVPPCMLWQEDKVSRWQPTGDKGQKGVASPRTAPASLGDLPLSRGGKSTASPCLWGG